MGSVGVLQAASPHSMTSITQQEEVQLCVTLPLQLLKLVHTTCQGKFSYAM